MRRSILPMILGMVCAIAWPLFAEEGPSCADCHDEVAAGMKNQIHMRIKSFEVYGREVGCVGCHGDGTAHMEEGDPALIRTFQKADDNQVCIECHQNKQHPDWASSTHAMEGIVCTDCHTIHKRNNPLNTCRKCHADVYGQFRLPNHHPVREGKMSCVSCHDPHSSTDMMLKTPTGRTNELCYTCHQDKEGPFVFEHEPVEEDCMLCHVAHGSVADNLLTAQEPMLCHRIRESLWKPQHECGHDITLQPVPFPDPRYRSALADGFRRWSRTGAVRKGEAYEIRSTHSAHHRPRHTAPVGDGG